MVSKTSPFDLYFHQTSKSAKSSDTLFSQTSHPLSRTQLDAHLANNPAYAQKHAPERARLRDESKALFGHWFTELLEGFNVLFYGFGSKRTLVNEFATEQCSEEGHIVVVNGYLPNVGTADILSSIEQIPGLVDHSKLEGGSTAEHRARRVSSFFSSLSPDTADAPLFLIIHNIDAPQLRTPRAQRVLTTLASTRHVHLVATVDHVNSALLFSRDQALARKPHLGPLHSGDEGRGFKGWSWLWHDLTTFEPYTAELAHRDLTVPPSASSSSAAAPTAGTTVPSEVTPSAAQHVFASVTTKAQKLFRLLATRQLGALQDEGAARIPASGMDKYGVGFDTLLGAARDEFVAANEAAMRGLLGEFRDHGMVLGKESEKEGGGVEEVLWVPAQQDVLQTILGYLTV
ncbi:Origin recognition complex subunit 2 [Ceratobasidium sp. 392]|nr:Origin recognition complex subunit 2 [Ceratobasidium sp. 392]